VDIILSRKDAYSRGATHYFTGVPCSKGHLAPRWVCDRKCTECQRLKKRPYRARAPGVLRTPRRTAEQQALVNRLRRNLTMRAWNAVKSRYRSSLPVLIGCSIDDLKRHLERMFEKGMSWGNYGVYWEIDHILPLSSFDVFDLTELRRVCHFTNLRPLRRIANQTKSKARQFVL
jgi:hypothetical protein